MAAPRAQADGFNDHGTVNDGAVRAASSGAEPQAHEILPHLLVCMEQGVVIVGQDDRLVLCNARAAEVLGWPTHIKPTDHDRRELDARETAIGLQRAGARRHVSRHPLPDGAELRLYSDPDWLRRPVDRDMLDAGDGDSLFRNSVIGVYRSSLDGTQVRANPALVRLNGLESEEELIAMVHDIGNEWYVDPGRREAFKRLMEAHGEVTDFVSEVITTGTRRRIWVSENAWVVRDTDGDPAFYEGTVVEASQRIRDEARNAHLARHDGLTGLANRTHFHEQLRGALQAHALGRDHADGIALVCVDLDRFKDVNDTFGHEAGDALLQAIGARLGAAAGGRDCAGRLGGDEFALIFERVADSEALAQRLDTLIAALRAPLSLAGREYHPSVSIGAAIGPRDGAEADDLYRSADAALYAVKGEGRDAWRIFDGDLRRQALRQRSLARALEGLLGERGRDAGASATLPAPLKLAYTPFIATGDGRHSGFAVTPVWPHPEGEVAGRDLFAVAEASNLVGNLFDRMLGEVIAMRHRLVAAGHEPGLFSLPVSAALLRDPQRPSGIEATLREAGILPVHFELALPEQALHDRSADTIRDALGYLSEAGMRVALEDFGSGHASLTQLRRFPVDLVRMGAPLIAAIDRPGAEADLPQTILALARGFGLQGAASGVVRQSQFDQLARWGCHYVLGDLVSPRLERDGAVIAYLAARAALIGNADAFLV
ncbi:MAG: diguanylate cyclase [Salinarimonas sp.]|nr:diguanylate cyclase [Salinarimonas sp.]